MLRDYPGLTSSNCFDPRIFNSKKNGPKWKGEPQGSGPGPGRRAVIAGRLEPEAGPPVNRPRYHSSPSSSIGVSHGDTASQQFPGPPRRFTAAQPRSAGLLCPRTLLCGLSPQRPGLSARCRQLRWGLTGRVAGSLPGTARLRLESPTRSRQHGLNQSPA